MKATTLTSLLVSALLAAAHPGPHAPSKRSQEELARRDFASSKCARHVGEMQKRRVENRAQGLTKRNTSVTVTTESPYYPTIQNETCILTPEATTGPYIWEVSQTLRQDMTEDQPGIPLIMDIGVIDINTCEPMQNVLVDLWHCNATGSYSSFTKLSPNTPFEELLEELNYTIVDDNFRSSHRRHHLPPRNVAHGCQRHDGDEDNRSRILRPEDRAHSRSDWVLQSNGTVKTDTTANTGQIFLSDDLSEYLMSTEPYVSHTEINRTTNAEDAIYAAEAVNGWFPELAVIPMDGEDYANGIIGYITIGVDSTRTNASTLMGDGVVTH
ncbi:dioxygenase [Armillaria mellea]|nr:dioxygenase [Armillaria mellea]